MSYHRRRTLAIWITVGVVFAPLVVGPAALNMIREPPELRLFYALPLVLPALVLVAFIMLARADLRVDETLTGPGTVAFATQNVPGAIVYLEPFLMPGTRFARGRTFVIVADGAGIRYFTAGRNPVEFVRIRWSEIADVAELSGELCITLADGNLLLHVPGGILPSGVKRVRQLARDISALQRERQL